MNSVPLQSLPIGTLFVDPETGEQFEIASRTDWSINECDFDIMAACQEGLSYTIHGFDGEATRFFCMGDEFRFPGDLEVTEFYPPNESEE